WVEPEGKVGGQHARSATLRGIMGIRHTPGTGAALRLPLVCAGRTLFQFPLKREQVPEEVVAPLDRRLGPDHFRATGDRIIPFAGAVTALPPEALLLDGGRVGLRPDV